ncbi:hypothetical protein K469DRAFT_787656 [Zopfia rhizophila CBS 207.26]|uniref:Uncharacterized protein n=1 Tax=Zopfia rhizophila CBS 207.26 TaxID=1314779 RepID=A0A6A6DXH4_9PEZI|nr:hypothetical protein K469DRAFT_787656 [Zopfia rhizophila CBS 207.26]
MTDLRPEAFAKRLDEPLDAQPENTHRNAHLIRFNYHGCGEPDENMVSDGGTDIPCDLLARKYPGDEKKNPVEAAVQRKMADFTKTEQIRAGCDSIVRNKENVESLKPRYNQFCKRPGFHDEYLQTSNRPNARLVDIRANGADRDYGKAERWQMERSLKLIV